MPLGQCTTMPRHVAAAVRERDAQRARGRPGHGPADGVVRIRVRAAVLVEAAQQIRDVLGRFVQSRPFDETAVQVADDGAAVVAEDVEEQRVVELAQLLDRVDQPTDLVVGVLGQRRVDLHLAREHLLRVGVEAVPLLHAVGVRRRASVPGGTMPSSICRFSVVSRNLSQPSSNSPL